MRILISGASGFIGAPLASYFKDKGHSVYFLVRSKTDEPNTVEWDLDSGKLIRESFEGFDAVIHLAGEPLTLSRWNEKKREKILHSRTVGTWLLSQVLSTLIHPPKVFISASAVGFYGSRGEELLDERSSSSSIGFLPAVCREWEAASRSIENRGTRTVRTRFGMVIGKGSRAVEKMVSVYKLGLGGPLGNGEQWVSWIALEDLIRAMDHVLNSDLEGSVNFVSPHPVRQKEFSATLAKILHRPSFFKVPAFILKLLLGSTADELLLASTKVVPKKLIDSGFEFQYPDLKDALRCSIK